eukprot:6484410-Prymnesium_polylepis.2
MPVPPYSCRPVLSARLSCLVCRRSSSVGGRGAGGVGGAFPDPASAIRVPSGNREPAGIPARVSSVVCRVVSVETRDTRVANKARRSANTRNIRNPNGNPE